MPYDIIIILLDGLPIGQFERAGCKAADLQNQQRASGVTSAMPHPFSVLFEDTCHVQQHSNKVS